MRAISIEPLSAEHHREDFDCGEDPLNRYLRQYASQHQKKNIGRVYVAVEPGEKRVLGYYTLANGSVAFENVPKSRGLPREYPIPVVLEHTTETLNFFGVQIELYRIGDSPLAPKFEVVVKPSTWAKSNREQAKAATASSPTKQLQLQFWNALVDKLSAKAPGIKPQKPRAQHWQQITLGRSGFLLSATANQRDSRLGVEIYLNGTDAKERFRQLREKQPEIETKLGHALDWQELPDANASRIALYRTGSPLGNESRWGDYLDWMIAQVVKFDAVFLKISQSQKKSPFHFVLAGAILARRPRSGM